MPADVSLVYESSPLQKKVDAIGLNDRAVDIWKPIIAIATVLAEDSVPQLIALARDMSPDPDRQEEQRQLSIASVLRTVAGPEGMLMGTTQQIIGQIQAVTSVEAGDLHAVLTGWGFSEKSIRLNGIETPRRGWQITESDLREVETKLQTDGLPPEPATTTTTTRD